MKVNHEQLPKSKLLAALMVRDNPDSKNFINAQIAYLEQLKNRERLEAVQRSIKKQGQKKKVKAKKPKQMYSS